MVRPDQQPCLQSPERLTFPSGMEIVADRQPEGESPDSRSAHAMNVGSREADETRNASAETTRACVIVFDGLID